MDTNKIKNEVVVQILQGDIHIELLYVPLPPAEVPKFKDKEWFKEDAIEDKSSKIVEQGGYLVPLYRIISKFNV